MVPVVGVNLASYLSDSVLDEWFPLLVTPKDPVESHLGVCKALHTQRRDLVLQTAVDRNNEFREKKC